jgi:hypothetical protein
VPGENPVEALTLKTGTTTGSLDKGEEIWYTFEYHDWDDDATANRDFEIFLTSTPLNQVRARHADFEIYPGGQLHVWTRGTFEDLEPMGTSSPSIYPTKDEKSLKVGWNGQFMEGQVYFIKVYNHDIGPLEYDLELIGGS